MSQRRTVNHRNKVSHGVSPPQSTGSQADLKGQVCNRSSAGIICGLVEVASRPVIHLPHHSRGIWASSSDFLQFKSYAPRHGSIDIRCAEKQPTMKGTTKLFEIAVRANLLVISALLASVLRYEIKQK
jgi:hypothetical protein